MKNLFITSINPGVGKSTFTLALGLKLKQEGHNVGYFKPITDSTQDTDAKDAKELMKMSENLKTICPVIVTSFEYDMTNEQRKKILEKIISSYKKLKASYDFLLIEGCRKISYLALLKLSTKELASMLDSKILLVSSGEEVEDADRIILGKNYLSDVDLIGAVFTLVPDELFQHFRTAICPKLTEQEKVEIFGLVPSRPNLVAPSVEEIQSTLNAKVIAGRDHINKLVEDYVVGAMEPDQALKYFRKSIRKAVITGGDRPQLALAAMETDTSCLILTGSILPPAPVLARAEEREIPVLSVSLDTFRTVKKLTEMHVYGKLRLDQTDKIKAWDEIFNDVNYDRILELLT